MDLDRAFRQAEDYLRRHLKSKAVREAEKRRLRRRTEEAMRRIGRAAALTGASGAGVVGYGLAIAPVGAAGLIAVGGATVAAAVALLLRPTRKAAAAGTLALAGLGALAADAEDWLLGKRPDLPGRALPALDAILARLHDLAPHLATLDPVSPLAGEARRLIGGHLPRLIDAYLDLPAVARETDAAIAPRLVEGLGTVADALTDLCREISRDSLFTFETQRRFLESRYRGGSL